MKAEGPISRADVEALAARLQGEAEASGYHLNPDRDFTLGLAEGLLRNEARYGYRSCPCRLASGSKDDDLDIVCPCDYRDADLVDWGACYCALYVSDEVVTGAKAVEPVPERRPPASERRAAWTKRRPESAAGPAPQGSSSAVPLPVWRCRVCGYLCAREKPPGVCPICKAKADRFERFL